MIRTVVLVAALLPYAYFAARDNALHVGKRKARAVPLAEHALHILVVAPLAWLIGGVFTRDVHAAAFGLLAFLPAALADEVVFHRRDLPAVELDVHAKSHLALLFFLAVAALAWLDDAGVRVLPWR